MAVIVTMCAALAQASRGQKLMYIYIYKLGGCLIPPPHSALSQPSRCTNYRVEVVSLSRAALIPLQIIDPRQRQENA